MSHNFRNPQVRDLLLITFAVAACMSVLTWAFKTVLAKQDLGFSLVTAGIFLRAVCCGVFLAAIGWYVEANSKFGKHFLHPGYALIAMVGFSTLAQISSLLIMALEQDGSMLMIARAAPTVIFFFASWLTILFAAIDNPGAWRLYFIVVLTPIVMVQMVMSRFLTAVQLGSAMSAISLLFGSFIFYPLIVDLNKSRYRDWVHWIGVIMAVLTNCVIPLWAFVYLYWMNLAP